MGHKRDEFGGRVGSKWYNTWDCTTMDNMATPSLHARAWFLASSRVQEVPRRADVTRIEKRRGPRSTDETGDGGLLGFRSWSVSASVFLCLCICCAFVVLIPAAWPSLSCRLRVTDCLLLVSGLGFEVLDSIILVGCKRLSPVRPQHAVSPCRPASLCGCRISHGRRSSHPRCHRRLFCVGA